MGCSVPIMKTINDNIFAVIEAVMKTTSVFLSLESGGEASLRR